MVASFVTQSETTYAIKEALSLIMKWNLSWYPKHFMVDYAEEEINAVESLFPGISLYIVSIWRNFFTQLFLIHERMKT